MWFSSTLPDSERNVCNKTNQQGTITNHKRTINERVKTLKEYGFKMLEVLLKVFIKKPKRF